MNKLEDNEIVIFQNAIKTPDGTFLISKGVHDYISHVDKNGEFYAIDGGLEYFKGSEPISKKTLWDKFLGFIGMYKNKLASIDMSITSETLFKEVRTRLHRGSNGKYGNEEFQWIPLKDMGTEWIKAAIKYNKKYRLENSFPSLMYAKELSYRRINESDKRLAEKLLNTKVRNLI